MESDETMESVETIESNETMESDDTLHHAKPEKCTLCGDDCVGRKAEIASCPVCDASYCGAPCKETDSKIHELLCDSLDGDGPPGTRRGLFFAYDRLRPEFVWLQPDSDPSEVKRMLEVGVHYVGTTSVYRHPNFLWSEAGGDDENSTVLNPIRHRPMRKLAAYSTRLSTYPLNKCVKETLDKCEKWLELDLEIGVPPLDDCARVPRSWQGDLIFDAGPDSGGINMTDVRDIVDFLSVYRQTGPVERGQTKERSRKIQVVEMDCQGRREDDRRAKPIITQLEWPLDHPLLSRWRPSRNSDQPFPRRASGYQFNTRLMLVLDELRLPLLTGETDPIITPALGTDTNRPRRIILRRTHGDFDTAHFQVFMSFFRNIGRSIRGPVIRNCPLGPIDGHIHPFLIRRLWQLHHYNYLTMRCVVPGCKPYSDCPLKPQHHDPLSILGKRLLKRVFGELHQPDDAAS